MNREKDPGMGRLPAMAPLATPYVPFQMENPQQYSPRRGLIRGTMHPGLDLPFMGMSNTREKPDAPLPNLQAVGFALTDLALYLDTHPNDREALERYRQLQRQYAVMFQEFGEKCRPLTHRGMPHEGEYTWLKGPWPWEYRGQEG